MSQAKKYKWSILIECDAEHIGSINDNYFVKWEYGNKEGLRIPSSAIKGIMIVDESKEEKL